MQGSTEHVFHCVGVSAFSTLWKCLLRVPSYVSMFQECLWTEHYIAAQGNNIFSFRGTFSSLLSQTIWVIGNCGKGKESDPTDTLADTPPTHYQCVSWHTTNTSADTLPTRRLTHYQHIGKIKCIGRNLNHCHFENVTQRAGKI